LGGVIPSTPTPSTARWRDEPVVPHDYEDIASLVRVAREARGRIVEFDWVFTLADLRRLRRAVFEWGSNVAGRYKCFDARVLAAINDVLGETDTILALNEPIRADEVDCRVSCEGDGNCFRLRGHAPFDIVFGYGSAGITQDPLVSIRLGPTTQRTLANAVGMLNWDLHRLQEERLRPVRNALFGLPLSYGIQELGSDPGPPIDVHVHFQGPFSAMDEPGCRCLFANEIAAGVGIYLWTINVGGEEWAWYVLPPGRTSTSSELRRTRQ
jgi:hypothetical protein